MSKIGGIYCWLALISGFLFHQNEGAAQRNSQPASYVGMYAGVSLTAFSDGFESNIPGNSGRVRLRTVYGFYGNISLNPDLSIYTAFELALKGGRTTGTELSGRTEVDYTAKTNVTAFNLPVLLNYTPRKEWGILVGPQLVYVLSSKEPWYKSSLYKPDDYQEDTGFKFHDFSLDVAFAFQYRFFTNAILQVRYSTGITPIVKPEYGGVSSNSFILFLGINFPERKGPSRF
jgi:hypothetical protein